jgi:hypothetical protein
MKEAHHFPEASPGQKLSSILLEETRLQQQREEATSTTPETGAPQPAQRNAYTKPVCYKIIVLGESGVGINTVLFLIVKWGSFTP